MTHDPAFLDFGDATGEERWYVVGATDCLRVLFLVFTFRGERLRPVTGWNADKRLREMYFRSKKE